LGREGCAVGIKRVTVKRGGLRWRGGAWETAFVVFLSSEDTEGEVSIVPPLGMSGGMNAEYLCGKEKKKELTALINCFSRAGGGSGNAAY